MMDETGPLDTQGPETDPPATDLPATDKLADRVTGPIDPGVSQALSIARTIVTLPADQRETSMTAACGDDKGLRSRVETMVTSMDPAATFDAGATIAQPPAHGASRSSARGLGDSKPESVGPYRIIHELGRGGMGVVYLAVRRDDRFQRQVAIKLLKRGMDTEDVLRRFELERDLLAALNHPHIARLIAGGETAEGLPYLVMEYVEGLELSDYCDRHRLTITERLELFRKVCAAVHHAHQNLVVHRDLKPSNVLVSNEGEPKLLDFGIAKLVNPELALLAGDPTRPEHRVMTPEYASPEQVRGGPISTSSDVYALGVILYELLTGHPPYRIKTYVRDEIERVVCDEDPERPSTAIRRTEEVPTSGQSTTTLTPESISRLRESRPQRLRRNLAGDIDNIVMMAMRKEPQRRYKSVEQFSADIQRHLDGLPVVARADTFGYRTSKFVGRNRGSVAAASVMVTLMVAGIAGTTTQWREAARREQQVIAEKAEVAKQRDIADEQRDLANAHVDRLVEMSQVFLIDIHDAVQTLDGGLAVREILVDTAYAHLQSLADEVADDPRLIRELARAYDRIGEIYGGTRNPNKGDQAVALVNFRRGLALRESLLLADPTHVELLRESTTSHMHIGDVLKRQGDTTGAMESYQTALAIRADLTQQYPGDLRVRRNYASSLIAVGEILIAQGERDRALQLYEQSLQIRKKLVADFPDRPQQRRELAVGHLRLGGRLDDIGAYGRSLEHYREAERIRFDLSRSEPENSRWRRDLAMARYFVGRAFLFQHRPDDAITPLQQALASSIQRAEANPGNARAQRDLAAMHAILAEAQEALRDWNAARESYDAADGVTQPLLAVAPDNTQYTRMAVANLEGLARVDAAVGRRADAIRSLRRAVAMMETLTTLDALDVGRQEDLARLRVALGRQLIRDGRAGEAIALLEIARDRFETLHENFPADASVRTGLAEALHELSRLMLALKDDHQALDYARGAIDTSPEPTIEMRRDLADILARTGATTEAHAVAEDAIKRLDAGEHLKGNADDIRKELEAALARYAKG